MAAGIVPELYQRIHSEFEQNMKASRQIRSFRSRENHTAKEVSLYSAEIGRCASDALSAWLTEDALPDGKLYWNIAQRTIIPLLKEAYELVMDAAEQMQREQDARISVNIPPIRPEFPEERIKGLINKLIGYQEDTDGNEI